MMVIWLAWLFAIGYGCLQGYYLYHWLKQPSERSFTDIDLSKGATIVIVAHNESENIQACINSILQQQYPQELYEVIIVDDHSTDDTIAKINAINAEHIQCLRLIDFPEYINEPAFKKSAIALAVDQARYENIVVTDADCVYHENWLSTTLSAFIQKNRVFQTGPVLLTNGNSLLEKMQETEQLALMLITDAGISSGLHDIANGANMIFTKEAFKKVDGYEGNYQFASGDDMFLIEKMRAAYPNQIAFLKSTDATAFTKGKTTWNDLIAQRLRWAGKNKGLKSKSIQNIWSFVGLYHLLLLLTFVAAILALIPWTPFLTLLIGKWLSDYFVINAAATFFKRAELVRLFVTLQLYYFWYIIRLSLAMAFRKNSDWRQGVNEK